jgi:thiamine transport system substrate-binding protein
MIRACMLPLIAALALASCAGGDETPTEVVLVTHDSFAIADDVKKAFEDESGLTLRILKAGDAGELVTRALLTAGNPEGDVLFGVDNNLLARALDGDVFEPYESPELDTVDAALVLDPEHRATPIDRGDVCLNYDRSFYANAGLAPPRNLVELTLPRYRGQLVVENPATSTPGLAFMLATIARFGDRWQGYWCE